MFYIYPVRQILFLVSSWSWWWRDTSPHRLVCPVVSSKYYFIIEQEIRRNWPYIFSFSRVIQSECTRTSWRICHCTQPELALEISCCIFYIYSSVLSNQYIDLISIVHILVMPGIHMRLVGPGFPVEYRRGGAEPADGAPACNQLYQSLPQGEAIDQFNLFIRIFCSRRWL